MAATPQAAGTGGSGVHVVVGAALVRAGRVLMVHRSPGRRWYPDVWDLPGGHIEPGERPREAVVRELREELGVDAEVTEQPFARCVGEDFAMDVWRVRAWSGEVANADACEHDAIAWLTPGELSGRVLAHPDLPELVRRALEG